MADFHINIGSDCNEIGVLEDSKILRFSDFTEPPRWD